MSQDELLRDSADGEWAVRSEQVKLLYESLPLSLLLTLVIAPSLTVIQWNSIEHSPALVWLALIVAVSLLRAGLAFAYYRAKPEAENSRRWEYFFVFGSVVAALLWGSSAFILYAEQSMVHQVFLAFIVGGVAAGSITALSALQFPAISFVALTMAPLIARLFYDRTEMSVAMAAMLLLFLIMLIGNASRFYFNTRQNITLRMQSQISEAALAQSEERFRELFEGNRSVELIIDPENGSIIEANHAAEQYYGYDREQLLSMKISQINMLSETEVASEMKQADTEQRNHFFFRHQLANGEIRDVEVHSGPIHWNRKRVLYSIVHDITARKQAEERLRKLSQAMEQAGESVVITDKNGIIEYVNPAFTKITGFRPDEAIGETPRILKSGRQDAAFYDELWRTISGGGIWHKQMVERRKDGTFYPAIVSIAPILNEENEITHYVGIQQDMSEHEVLENKFRQAQKMEALGTLVGGIAHDFNNMLAGITGNLYLMKRRVTDTPDLAEKVEMIESLSFRAASMITQLMTFARKGIVENAPFGLTSFIQEISKLSEASIPENITFNSLICPEELVVRGDSTQLQQVMMNLLNNARDALGDVADPVITLSLEEYRADELFREAHPDCPGTLFARLTVEDNGCGITEDDKEHIFEPFFTTKEVGIGTGLGLSMVYGAVKSQGGAIEVESEPGRGSAFSIYLPLIREMELLPEIESHESLAPGAGETILICDDNAQVRNTLRDVLESLNYRVISASGGLEAVDLYRANSGEVSLIIMDVVMPQVGGVRAIGRIHEINPDARVIFATGYDKDETLKSEMPAEKYPMLSKPYNIHRLSRMIREQLDS